MWQHEDYDHNIIINDVSVLELDEPLEFNEYVQPMKLAEQGKLVIPLIKMILFNLGQDPVGGTECINSGWGSTSDSAVSQMPNKLQYVMLPIVDRETCTADYNGINGVDQGMVCAGQAAGGISPCSGDSGGPLVCPGEDGEYYLAGIVSWGVIPCGQADKPGVFTNAGHYRDWIDMHIAM